MTMEVGAVAAMRYVKDGIRAARLLMQHTKHTLLVGEKASAFAISMGLPGPIDLSSPESKEKWTKWREDSCQPNFWKNVVPADSCGPYQPTDNTGLTNGACSKASIFGSIEYRSSLFGLRSHDTISMAVIDKYRWVILLLEHQLMEPLLRYLEGWVMDQLLDLQHMLMMK